MIVAMCLVAPHAIAAATDSPWSLEQLDPIVAEQITRKMGPGVDAHHTQHFTLLHPDHEAWAKHTGNLLEQAHAEFYRAFGAAGFDLRPVEKPLVWLCFPDREGFNEYAQVADRIDMSWSQGYYSARTNLVAVIQTPAYPRSESDSSAPKTQVVTTVYSNDDASARASRLESARATHELAHQLAFNSGLQKRGVMYPLWASEGLATNFEADASGKITFGSANAFRRRALVGAWRGDRLVPLSEFVTLSRINPGDGRAISDIYAQCWGLFQFLMDEYPSQTGRYMKLLADAEAGYRDEWSMRREFVAAFGPIWKVERKWNDYVQRLADGKE
jgi:hypothetical protein